MGSLSVPRRTRLRDSQEPEGSVVAIAVYSNLPLPFEMRAWHTKCKDLPHDMYLVAQSVIGNGWTALFVPL